MARLGDVCKRGSSNLMKKDIEQLSGDYPIYGASGLIGTSDFYHQDRPYVAVVKDGAGVGRTMLLPAKSSVIGTLQYLIPKDNILPDYLYYVVQHMRLEKYCTGATIPHIYFKDYKDESFHLDNIQKQHQVVSILNKVSTLISLRKQQLAKLDELVRARFVEMFGDPVVNSMGWETRAGEALFKLSNGKAVPEQRRFSSGVPAYGGNGISWFTDSSIIDHDTIVVGRVGFQSGNVHYAEGPLWVTDNAMFISNYKQEDCDLRFLYYLMEIMNFTRFQDDGDLKKITQKPFMRAKYILPPLYLQKQYISDVEVYDRNSELIKLSLDKLETLKNALMQEYF